MSSLLPKKNVAYKIAWLGKPIRTQDSALRLAAHEPSMVSYVFCPYGYLTFLKTFFPCTDRYNTRGSLRSPKYGSLQLAAGYQWRDTILFRAVPSPPPPLQKGEIKGRFTQLERDGFMKTYVNTLIRC